MRAADQEFLSIQKLIHQTQTISSRPKQVLNCPRRDIIIDFKKKIRQAKKPYFGPSERSTLPEI